MTAPAQLQDALSGRYAIDREIGAGGMATVYLARDLRHDRRVALKVLKPDLGAVLGVERFLTEIKVTANLQHPNLLPLFDSGEANGLLYYVMPFVEGESLRARLDRERQLPIDEAIRIATAIASALTYAHSHDVIHRDLKPENILLQSGEPVIADFGIALAVSNAGGARVTQTGLSLGTPNYMSPEQATADRGIDARTDIYSLGAMLYEMLSGDPPHTGSTAQAVIARVLTERPRSIRALRPSVPEHIEASVERALEKLPADRWPTAAQFADALHGRATTTIAQRTGGGYGSGLAGWRAQLRSPVVLGSVAVAALAVAAAIRQSVALSRVPQPTTVRFPLLMPPSIRPFPAAIGSSVAMSRDGRIVAFVGAAGSSIQLYVRTLADARVRALPGTDGGRQPFFSPDGRWIAFWAAGKLQKTSIDAGSILPLADTPLYAGGVWTTGDQIVISDNLRLLVVPAAGGILRPVTTPDPTTAQLWPVAGQNADEVVYASGGPGGLSQSKIAIASISTGERTVLDLFGTAPLGIVGGYLAFTSAAGTILAVPFDIARQRVIGAPVPVLTDAFVGGGAVARAGISAQGSIVYLTASSATQLVVSDPRGATRLLVPEPKMYRYPRLSPDGSRVAVAIVTAMRTDVWIIEVASGTATRLTSEGTANERPEWTRDGKRLMFRTDRDGRSAIWWQPADLSGPATPLVSHARADYFEAVPTPDGRHVVYQVDTTGADLVYRTLTGNTTEQPVATARFLESMPRVSGDGRWIAYVSDETGTSQVMVQPFPGLGARVQVSATGGSEPVWAPDRPRLYYRDGQRIMAASYTTSPSFAVTARSAMFDDVFLPAVSPHANYDVFPRGDRFLFLKGAEDQQVMIVHNWLTELRGRMSGAR